VCFGDTHPAEDVIGTFEIQKVLAKLSTWDSQISEVLFSKVFSKDKIKK